MNKMANSLGVKMANVPINSVLDKSAFNLDRALIRRPTFITEQMCTHGKFIQLNLGWT